MQPSTVSRTILCVDDEAGALLVRKAVLKSAGYKVITALNAGDALAILDRAISTWLSPITCYQVSQESKWRSK